MIKIKDNTYNYNTGKVEPMLYDVATWWKGSFNKEAGCIEERIDALVQHFATLLALMVERGDMDKDMLGKFVSGWQEIVMVKDED